MYSINRLMSTSLATFCTVTFSNPRILFWRTYCFVDHCLYICLFPFGYCVFCLSSIYGFWLPLWYLLITSLVSSDYLFGIFWLPLWYLLITSLVSSGYLFGIFKLFWQVLTKCSIVQYLVVSWRDSNNTNGRKQPWPFLWNSIISL